MLGLDIIGAGESLASRTILLRIRSIDPVKLRAGITSSSWGAVIPFAVDMVDKAPQAALDIVVPIVKSQLANIGVTADVSYTDKPPGSAPQNEGLKTLAMGGVAGFLVGVLLALFGRKVYHLVH